MLVQMPSVLCLCLSRDAHCLGSPRLAAYIKTRTAAHAINCCAPLRRLLLYLPHCPRTEAQYLGVIFSRRKKSGTQIPLSILGCHVRSFIFLSAHLAFCHHSFYMASILLLPPTYCYTFTAICPYALLVFCTQLHFIGYRL